MTESISKYQKRNDDYVILDNRNRKKFFDELQDGEIYIEILQKASKLRSYLQNKYYWGGVLSEFVKNGNFDNVNEAHDFFSRRYLRANGIYEECDTIQMQRELSKARVILSTIMRNGILEVHYILSTASLSTKQFNSYMDSIIIDAAQLGIVIKSPEEYYAQAD